MSNVLNDAQEIISDTQLLLNNADTTLRDVDEGLRNIDMITDIICKKEHCPCFNSNCTTEYPNSHCQISTGGCICNVGYKYLSNKCV